MNGAALSPVFAFLVIAITVAPAASQSVFPVQFNEPEPQAPATALSAGALTIHSDTDFRARGALTVVPTMQENLLRIDATQDDTVIWAEVLVAGAESDATVGAHSRQYLAQLIYDSSGGTWAFLGVAVAVDFGGGMSIDVTPVGNQVTLSFTTPNDIDQVIYRIEVIANKSVTFTPLV